MSQHSSAAMTPTKRPELILCSFGVWLALMAWVIVPWLPALRQLDRVLLVLVAVNTAIWWLMLLWAFHHLAFQLGALFVRNPVMAHASEQPTVAILYVTCDDFNRECCSSCLPLRQNYEKAHLFICDDSESTEYRAEVNDFVAAHAQEGCTLVRRGNRQHYKAGNLNHAIQNEVKQDWDWLLIVDADQMLGENYLVQLARGLPKNNSKVAFVQGAHKAREGEQSSHFQRIFSPDVEMYYSRDLVLRVPMGFLPLLGHGALVSRSAWESVGGFPLVVSEDFAFSLEAACHGWRGVYWSRAVSNEACPWDFGGFTVRLRKYAGGTAELIRKCLPSFVRGPAAFVEKWDFAMQIGLYALMPLVTFNGFLSAYVMHRLWTPGILLIHPILPYLYVGLLMCVFTLRASVVRSWGVALRFFFWSTAIAFSVMPVVSVSFLKHLFRDPVFSRTPKNGEETELSPAESVMVALLGLAALACALFWSSPFSLVIAGQGIAYLSYPLYGKLCSDSIAGTSARLAIYVPGAFVIAALYVLWAWSSW